MALDIARITEDAIQEAVENEFADIPIKLRIKHISRIEAINPSTVWRWYNSGKLPRPSRDGQGPYWLRDAYKADLLERMLADQEGAA